MKKLLSLLLALMMLLSLAACGSKGPDLQGKYKASVDLTDLVVENFDLGTGKLGGLSLGDYLTDFKLDLVMEFNEDGTYKVYLDTSTSALAKESLTTAAIGVMDDMIVALLDEQLSAYGYSISTKEDVETLLGMTWDEVFESSMGTTEQELVEELINDSLYMLFDGSTLSEGKYKAEDGKLYSSVSLDTDYTEDAYETYTLTKDGFTLTGGVNIEDNELITYPIDFVKVS